MRSAAISLRTRAISCSFWRKTKYGFFTEFLRQRIQQEFLGSTLWKVRKSITVARDAEGAGALESRIERLARPGINSFGIGGSHSQCAIRGHGLAVKNPFPDNSGISCFPDPTTH